MNVHSAFDSKYWNLAQAAAWVEYREKQLVEHFDMADREAYMALGMYPSMWPAGREQRGSVEELRHSLGEARLASWGYHVGERDRLQEVPAAEWADFIIRPPFAFRAGTPSTSQQRWSEIRVLSADMKRLWRSISEVSGRSRFDWVAIKTMYHQIKTQHPEMTQNELITEVQGAFEDNFNKEAPSRTSFMRKIKTWI